MTTTTSTVRELRHELNTALRARDRHKQNYEETLAQWTRDRAQYKERLRAALARERMLLKLLSDYLSGELDADTVTEKIGIQ